MPKMKVSLPKLEKYARDHGSYELTRSGEKQILLSFVPTFPEAVEKSDTSPPRVIMTGLITNGNVEFTKVEIENSEGETRERSMEEAELVYSSWLEYIEENY